MQPESLGTLVGVIPQDQHSHSPSQAAVTKVPHSVSTPHRSESSWSQATYKGLRSVSGTGLTYLQASVKGTGGFCSPVICCSSKLRPSGQFIYMKNEAVLMCLLVCVLPYYGQKSLWEGKLSKLLSKAY